METRELVCQCGCGKTFNQNGVGRVRKYLNDTHKSAANNSRTREAVKRGRSLQEAGLMVLICDSMEIEDIQAWYPDLTAAQWQVIDAIRATTLPYEVFIKTLVELSSW